MRSITLYVHPAKGDGWGTLNRNCANLAVLCALRQQTTTLERNAKMFRFNVIHIAERKPAAARLKAHVVERLFHGDWVDVTEKRFDQ